MSSRGGARAPERDGARPATAAHRAAEAAFTRFYDEHHSAIWRYAVRRTPDPDHAADVVSQTFVVAWRRWDAVPRDGEDARAWLYGVARRVLADMHRAASRRRRLAERLMSAVGRDEQVAPAPALDDGVLQVAWSRLPERDRELLALIAWEGLTAEQAARALGCLPGTLHVRLHRARRRLAALMADVAKDEA